MGYYRGKQLKDFGVVETILGNKACVRVTSLGAPPGQVYWVNCGELELGDRVCISNVVTSNGSWFVADKLQE